MKKQGKLTIKQEKFCNKYIECGNAAEAYRYAYSCGNMKAATIQKRSSELFNNGAIKGCIEVLKAQLRAKGIVNREDILAELAKIGFSSISHFHNTWIERKDFEELTDAQKASIKTIQTQTRKIETEAGVSEVEFVKIELYDKLKALDSISRMLGFDAPTKHEHTGRDGEDIKLSPLRIEIVTVDK